MGVEMEHRALDCPDEVLRILGPNVRFDQPANALRIREAVLNRSSPLADPRLYNVVHELGERML